MYFASLAILGISAYAATVIKTSLILWFALWAIRYRGELDRELSRGAKLLRWAVVVLAHTVVIVASSWLKYPAVRVSVWGVGAAFLAWPNLAYHVFNMLKPFRVADGAKISRPDNQA
jgi:hypothetical protein